jgi:hypothetical protein
MRLAAASQGEVFQGGPAAVMVIELFILAEIHTAAL